MAGTYASKSPTGEMTQVGDQNLYVDFGTFTDDTSQAHVTATTPMTGILFATAQLTDNTTYLKSTYSTSAGTVVFASPASGKTYNCIIFGYM